MDYPEGGLNPPEGGWSAVYLEVRARSRRKPGASPLLAPVSPADEHLPRRGPGAAAGCYYPARSRPRRLGSAGPSALGRRLAPHPPADAM